MKTPAPRDVLIEMNAGTKIITINRPGSHNAWTSAMRKEIGSALTDANEDQAVSCVVVIGAGTKAFCAGQDLSETMVFTGGEEIPEWISDLQGFYDAVRGFEKPLICALNGLAAGSGFQFALLCDVVVGHKGVTIGQPEVNSGIPSIFGPWIIGESLGMSRAVELCVTGRMMTAEEAHRLGIIHHLVSCDGVLDKAHSIAEDLARKPPQAMRITKKFLRIASEEGYKQALSNAAIGQREAFDTGEPQRTMDQFFALRSARKAKANSSNN